MTITILSVIIVVIIVAIIVGMIVMIIVAMIVIMIVVIIVFVVFLYQTTTMSMKAATHNDDNTVGGKNETTVN